MKRTFVTIVLVGLVAAACGGTTGDTTTTTEAPEETTTTGGQEITTSSEPSTTTTSAPGATGGTAGCLEGDWVLDNEALIEQIFADMLDEEAGLGEVSPAGGDLGVTFDDNGTVAISRDDWGFVIESEDGAFKILISGDQTGTWSVDGNELSISLDEGPPPDVTTSLIVDGQEVPLSQSPVDVPSEAFSSSSAFSCSGDTFSVTADEFTSTFNRP